MKKKIVIFDQCLGGGGAERVLCTVMRGLNPVEYKIELILCYNSEAYSHLIPSHVSVSLLGVKHTRNALLSLVKTLREKAPDIVYTTNTRAAVVVNLARYTGCRFIHITRYAGTPMLDIREGYIRGWRLFVLRLLYKKADHFIAQTKEIKEQLKSYYMIQRNVHVIFNPVDGQYIDENTINAANPFSTRSDAINIVASGTIYPIKGFDVLLRAFQKVREKDTRFHLHIIGRDEKGMKNELMKLGKELGVSEQLFFYGFQKNPYPFYKFCDVFVLSSRREALPNVVLECLYLGTPVVATRCADVMERIIDNGNNGYLVKVGDESEMAEALLDYKTLKPMKSDAVNANNEIVNLINRVCPAD